MPNFLYSTTPRKGVKLLEHVWNAGPDNLLMLCHAKDNFEFERQIPLCRSDSVLDLRHKK
jgi:hypothetical protein